MAKKTKFFRVAVEGVTTDGREISRDWIKQMAATYDPKKYGARAFAEHIRGMVPDGPFRAFGDVTALKAEEIEDGPLAGKLALYAQIDPSEAMVKLVNSGQKIYSSVEVDPDFTGSKQAYLVGLGITDSPASLGTEILQFAAQHPSASPFTARKRRPENLFSAAAETAIEIEPDDAADADAANLSGFFANFAAAIAKLAGNSKPNNHESEAVPPSPEAPASGAPAAESGALAMLGTLAQQFEAFGKATTTAITELREQVTEHRKAVDESLSAFQQTLDTPPTSYRRRPAATGGSGEIATDC